MSFICSPESKNLPFLLINNNNFSQSESIVKIDHKMWLKNNDLSLSNLLKEAL